jgi:hypothetical protein
MAKTEIVKQVKLTPNQKISLMEAAANGGKFERAPEWAVLQPLRFLRLIEERPKYAGKDLAALQTQIAQLWVKMPAIVKARDHNALERICRDISSLEYDRERKAYWITDAGKAYLTLGTVTIATTLADEKK